MFSDLSNFRRIFLRRGEFSVVIFQRTACSIFNPEETGISGCLYFQPITIEYFYRSNHICIRGLLLFEVEGQHFFGVTCTDTSTCLSVLCNRYTFWRNKPIFRFIRNPVWSSVPAEFKEPVRGEFTAYHSTPPHISQLWVWIFAVKNVTKSVWPFKSPFECISISGI